MEARFIFPSSGAAAGVGGSGILLGAMGRKGFPDPCWAMTEERVCLYMMTEGEKKQRREKTRGPWEGDNEVSDKIAGRKF